MVLQGRLYNNGSHPTCHLVHNLFKLNVQDLLYVISIVVYRRGLSWASVICFVHRSPEVDIIKRHNPTYHLYVDDTQLYVSFKLGSGDLPSSAKSSVEICV